MTIVLLQTVTATLQLSPTPLVLKVIDATITLDENRAPYGEIQLRIHTPAQADAETIDPRNNLRVTLVAGQTWKSPVRAAQSRTFDMVLHARTFDYATGEATLTLRTDEAKLIDDGLIATAVNTSAYAVESSLRAIINLVLATIGATLAAGTADANFTRTTNATNIVRNPRVGTNTTDWSQSGTASAITRVTSGGPTLAPTFYRITPASSSGAGALIVAIDRAGIVITAGVSYVLSAWVRCSAAVSLAMDGLTYTSGGALVQDLPESPVATPANTWQRLTLAFTAAATVTQMTVRLFNSLGTIPSGGTFDVTGVRVSAATGVHDDDYFDGFTTDANYTYAWLGTAHASQSTRTRLDNRSLTVLDRQPGQASWDFLQPLVQQAKLRLFCDESRVWRLVDSNSYIVDGSITAAAGDNLTGGSDQISLDGEWATGVVVKYTWDDAAGLTQTAYDAAGTGTRVTLIEWERPYPGAGAATVILARMQGRGRVLEMPLMSELTATPGQYFTAAVPNAPVQTGIAALVSFSIPDGIMGIGTRGLIDTPPDAYVFGSPAKQYNNLLTDPGYSTFDWSAV